MKLRIDRLVISFAFCIFDSRIRAQTSSNSHANASSHTTSTLHQSPEQFSIPMGSLWRARESRFCTAMARLEVMQTNQQGQYQFDDLRPGTYQVVGTSRASMR